MRVEVCVYVRAVLSPPGAGGLFECFGLGCSGVGPADLGGVLGVATLVAFVRHC